MWRSLAAEHAATPMVASNKVREENDIPSYYIAA
jgi:hypothetical protein